MFADPERLPRAVAFPTADAVVTAIDQAGLGALETLQREEERRYGAKIRDFDKDAIPESARFSAQVAYPSPIHHESRKWWLRIPRLGLCYTVNDALGHAGAPDIDEQHRNSDHILLISAIHAGNRMISRRLALLFANCFHWDCYKADDRIAETIARSLCFNEPHNRKLVDDDQKLYLVTKLLLGHHLFFPQSAETFAAITLLGKEPNEGVLLPHGWDAVTRWQSSSVGIGQCVDNLVLDLALLIKAFVRWDRPESLERVPDRDLEKEIRRFTGMALSLLCGDIVWIDNNEFYGVASPRSMVELGEVLLPALPKSAARSIIDSASKKGKREYDRYLTQWSMPDRRGSGGHYTTSMALFKHTLRGVEKRESPEMPWLNRYLRARIEHGVAATAQQPAAACLPQEFGTN
jgi:hypothetical protein